MIDKNLEPYKRHPTPFSLCANSRCDQRTACQRWVKHHNTVNPSKIVTLHPEAEGCNLFIPFAAEAVAV